jgi:hypothetical protein
LHFPSKSSRSTPIASPLWGEATERFIMGIMRIPPSRWYSSPVGRTYAICSNDTDKNVPDGSGIMNIQNPELAEFNRKHRDFWDDQKRRMKQRMADREILEIAVETIAFEAKRGVSVRSQMSFEKALEYSAEAKQRFIRRLARSGGKAAKADLLQKMIIDIVRQNPGVSLETLLKELRHRRGDGVIEDIDETHIYFRHAGVAPHGQMDEAIERKSTLMSAPISALKHRLTRARKKVSREGRSR